MSLIQIASSPSPSPPARTSTSPSSSAARWHPQLVSISTERLADQLRARLKSAGITTEVVHGTAGTVRVATLPEADFVVSAIVGVAGLEATYAAVLAGKTVGLANKECLVAAGDLILAAARERGVDLLPIDSEHNAIHQCLRGGAPNEVQQIWLTASGGPFRNTPLADFDHITPAQALKHPTWVMGQRITVDSATMLNKGLEIIEACRLFNLPPSQVSVTVHPQSTIHSLVEYVDGSILAQISVTDMRLPILYALSWPERIAKRPDLRHDRVEAARLPDARSSAFPLSTSRLRGCCGLPGALHRPQCRRRSRGRRLPFRATVFPRHSTYNRVCAFAHVGRLARIHSRGAPDGPKRTCSRRAGD